MSFLLVMNSIENKITENVTYQPLQQLLRTAMRRCTVVCRIIFGMLHNFQLRPIIPTQLRSVASILFCNGEKNRLINLIL